MGKASPRASGKATITGPNSYRKRGPVTLGNGLAGTRKRDGKNGKLGTANAKTEEKKKVQWLHYET